MCKGSLAELGHFDYHCMCIYIIIFVNVSGFVCMIVFVYYECVNV